MNRKHLLYISTLAKELSFSRASETLGISQPTLSQCVKKIEKELGVMLFLRNGTDIRLTDAGEAYLCYMREMVAVEARMEEAFSEMRGYGTGRLRMALSPSKCYTLMPEVIRRFRERYPGIRVSIREMLAGELLHGIDSGDFDLGVTPMPQQTGEYDCELILKEEILVAVPKSLPIYTALCREATPAMGHMFMAIDFGALAEQPFVVMQDWQVMQKQLVDLCELCGVPIQAVVECTNHLTMMTMTDSGIGLSLLPSSIVPFSRSMHQENIAFFSLRQQIPERQIVCLYKKKKRLSDPAKYMIQLLKKEI